MTNIWAAFGFSAVCIFLISLHPKKRLASHKINKKGTVAQQETCQTVTNNICIFQLEINRTDASSTQQILCFSAVRDQRVRFAGTAAGYAETQVLMCGMNYEVDSSDPAIKNKRAVACSINIYET